MSSRFESCPDQHYKLMHDIIGKYFPHLNNAVIELVFDTKKRSSGGKLVFGQIRKSNDLTRHLSASNDIPEGVDYILSLDKLVFENISDEDKVRILRHELQHATVDYEKNNPYNIRDHEITDFYDEIQFNQSDARWLERVSAVAESLYEKEDDDKKGEVND